MKILSKCMFVFFSFILILFNTGFVYTYKVDNDTNNNCAICFENVDHIELKELENLFNLKIPLTFKINNKERYKDYYKDKNLFVNSLVYPKIIGAIIVDKNSLDLRKAIYNSIALSKESGSSLLIFNLDEMDLNNVYFSILDSIKLFTSLNVKLVDFSCIVH